MVQAVVETAGDDIKTALNAESGFLQPNFTFYSVENDEDEDADFEYNVPNIIYGSESSPVEYFMDGSRMFLTDFIFQVNIGEFTTLESLTRKRLVNYTLDKLMKTLNDMTFSNVTPVEFNTAVGEMAARVPLGEDEFIYRGSLTLSVSYLDTTA